MTASYTTRTWRDGRGWWVVVLASDGREVLRAWGARSLRAAQQEADVAIRLDRARAPRTAAPAPTSDTARLLSPFTCQECGAEFATLRGAERAMADGCPTCGGADIDVGRYEPDASELDADLVQRTVRSAS